MRRSLRPDGLIDFYAGVVGLPVLRRSPEICVLWAGDTTIFEVMPGGTPTPQYQSRFDSPCTPLFRTHDLAVSVQRLSVAGVRFLEEVSVPGGQVAYFLDPDGNLTGLQERSRESTRSEDLEAFRRWDTGVRTIPDAGPLPAEIQHLGWVVLRVADLAAQTYFYRDILGLAIGHDMGERGFTFRVGAAMLELLPGGTARSAPTNRTLVTDTFILQIDDLDSAYADLTSQGITVLAEPFAIPDGRLAYFADPEGNPFGLAEGGGRNAEG